ncbi:MAG: glycosyltransferase family 4 protein [Bacteroidales bacterium]|nr:glycosyltransferase family 4 protein [Bacteroidales bacterium]
MPFSVVLNGSDIQRKDRDYSVRERYGIDKNDFLFVFVGNVNPNKNQRQVVEALALMPSEIRKNVKVLFVGGGDFDSLQEYISLRGLSENMIVAGPVDKKEVHNCYIDADATILTSLSEGFGLSIVEGYVYGKPAVTFCDLPAFRDICNSDSAVGVGERSDEALMQGMTECMRKTWDSEKIEAFATNFGYDSMKRGYLNLYKEILGK